MKTMSAETESGDFRDFSTALEQSASNRQDGCDLTRRVASGRLKAASSPFGRSPEFLGNRFVYAVISQRAHGLSIGVDFNPDKVCNFDCAYCEVNRDVPARETTVDLSVMAAELESLLER